MRLCLFLLAASLSAQPLVIAHRGGKALRPENTMEAFAHALTIGADVLELDVVVTTDKHLLVRHNTIEGQSRADVLKTNPTTPSLAEVLAFAKKSNARLMIETKMDPTTDPQWFTVEINKLIRKHGLSQQVILQSFDHRTLHAMRQLNPEVGLVLLNPAKRLDDYVTPAQALGPRAIQFVNFRIVDKAIVRTLHRAGIKVYSGTTDDAAEWKRLGELGVDGILTDNPEALRRLFPR